LRLFAQVDPENGTIFRGSGAVSENRKPWNLGQDRSISRFATGMAVIAA